jgi:hypothetical protein
VAPRHRGPGTVAGRGRTGLAGLALAAAVLVLAGCGGSGDPVPATPAGTPSGGPSATPSGTPSADAGATPGPADLTIVVKDGGSTLSSWHLTCDPEGGDHPDPRAACRALAAHGAKALPPVAAGTACTQIYGGSSTAVVSGTWRGQNVSSRFSLVNGCEVARWTALTGLLPQAKGAR